MATIVVVIDIVWSVDKPRGGHTMYALHWLRGLQKLGHRVVMLDLFAWKPHEHGDAPRQRFEQTMNQWWSLDDACMMDVATMKSLAGLSDQAFADVVDQADALVTLGIPNTYEPPSVVEKIRPRILLEQDPGYTHLWANSYPAEKIFGRQDFYYSVGLNIGHESCRMPTHGIQWRPVFNPVVLDWWKVDQPVNRDRFTTIAGWWDHGYIEFDGKVWGPKAEEFKKFIDVPKRSGETLEIALEIDAGSKDLDLLADNGWRVEDPAVVHSPDDYRRYVSGSAGEFSVTKGGYAGTNSGWFSDRSGCYLAAGRPVVVQETGFSRVLPTGKGLFAFKTPDEAAEALKAVRADYKAHCKAAREIAVEFFDSDRVLSRVLANAGIR